MSLGPPFDEFLLCRTPDSWIKRALENQDLLLIDHGHCEKKAASTAMNLMYRYVDNFDLLNKMSRLAREELRHFEQVLEILESRNIPYVHLTASRYAGSLRKIARKDEPGKLIDVLIIGSIIEARSCERFARIAPHLDEELHKFYLSLLKSEARHYSDYLGLARDAAGGEDIEQRVLEFLTLEKELVESADEEFRFHSGS